MTAVSTQSRPERSPPRPAPDPLLEIVIVSAGSARELVRGCLRSLERHPLRQGATSVWLVDNASADGTAETVRVEFPWVRLVALDSNSGFCIANNIALRASTAPYLLLLNPDTEVLDGSLDHLVDLMRERPDVGVAGCRLVLRDGSFDHAAKRSFPTPLSALAHFTGIGRGRKAPGALAQYRAPDLDEHATGEVDAVNGAFMLVRRAAVEQVGLLDERYRLYMEDLDWCYRFKQAGWRVLYDGRVSIVHVKGGTHVHRVNRSRHRGLRENAAFHRSMGRFYRKFYDGGRLRDLAIYVAIGVKLAIAVTRSTLARRVAR